jgi:dehydrogenase/reductase SDR family protein 12
MKKSPVEDLTALSAAGKTIVVTGANAGLGLGATEAFFLAGARVVMVVRSEEKGTAAKGELEEKHPNASGTLEVRVADVAQLDQVRALAASIDECDILVNNAGVMPTPYDELFFAHKDVELTLATNTLPTYFLTLALEEVMRKSRDPRVIAVSSGGGLTMPLTYRQSYMTSKSSWSNRDAYSRTKRHQIALCDWFTERRTPTTGIRYTAYHPGWSDTNAVRTAMPDFYEKVQSRLRTVEQGVDTLIWLALSEEVPITANFFRDRAPEYIHLPGAWTSHSVEDTDKLIDWLEELGNEWEK